MKKEKKKKRGGDNDAATGADEMELVRRERVDAASGRLERRTGTERQVHVGRLRYTHQKEGSSSW